jgi:histidine triad (HIT) family protein
MEEEGNMADCVFCKIVQGDAPASLVYEDSRCVSFMDLHPVNPGHLLLIPKRHSTDLSEMDPAEVGPLFLAARGLVQALRESGLRCEGVNLHLADGEAAGQEVFHVHLHIIPRFAGDGFGFRFGPNYAHLPNRRELDDHAQQIRAALISSSRK